MKFENLNVYDKFTIEKEPESLFYKLENRYDGAVNARQIRGNSEEMFKPVTFSKSYEIIHEVIT